LDTEEAEMVEKPRPNDAMSREAERRDGIEKALRTLVAVWRCDWSHVEEGVNGIEIAIKQAEEALRPEEVKP
jgi:hypothetical protein